MSVIEKDLDPDTFIGLQLPLGVHQMGVFKRTQTLLEQAKSNIRNLLLTRRGERLGNPDFGSDLFRVLFNPINETTQSEIEEIIRADIGRYLPYINVKKVEFSNEGNIIRPKVTFTIDIQNTKLEDIILELPSLEAPDTQATGGVTGTSPV